MGRRHREQFLILVTQEFEDTTFLEDDLSSLEFALLIYRPLKGMVCVMWLDNR